jgi:hypothetical protein
MMKWKIFNEVSSEAGFKSPLECGTPGPLFEGVEVGQRGEIVLDTVRGSSVLHKSAAGPAHSKTWRKFLKA